MATARRGVIGKARDAVDMALRIAREDALSMAQTKGLRAMQILLRTAQHELNQRLARIESSGGAGPDSFSAARARATLEQVQSVTAQLTHAMQPSLIQTATTASTAGAQNVIDHLARMDKLFRGIGVQPLALNEARLFDRAISGTRASLLHRLSSGARADSPTGMGILQRYGVEVVRNFEKRLQLAAITRQPWPEIRNDLVKESPFLQQAPAHWAERIVRTETMGAMNRSAWEASRAANDELGDVVKILCATFDNRTGSDSYAVHGQIRRPDEAFQWWQGLYQHPPNRPNDREVVIMHRIVWPLPPELQIKTDGDVASRWQKEGRKGSPPPRPKMTTVPFDVFGKPPEPTNTPTAPGEKRITPEQRAMLTRVLAGGIKVG